MWDTDATSCPVSFPNSHRYGPNTLRPHFSRRGILADDNAVQVLPIYGLSLIFGLLLQVVSSAISIWITAQEGSVASTCLYIVIIASARKRITPHHMSAYSGS